MRHRGRVTKRNDVTKNRWRYELDTIDPETSNRRKLTKGGFRTMAEAQAALDQVLQDREQGRAPGRPRKVGEWLVSEWLPAITPTLEPTTAMQYRATLRACVVPYIGGVKLGDVTGGTLTALYGQLGDRLAPKTIKNVHTLVHRFYRDAIAWGLVSVNPADNANPPKVRRSEPQTWDSKQLGDLFAILEGDRLSAMWRLFATTGLRRAEVLGLKWAAVDLDRGFLSVVRTRTEYSGRQFEKDTKTAAGRRRVSLDPITVMSLREHRRHQLEERLAWGEGWQDTGLTFTKEDGSPIRPAWVTAQLPKLAAKAGLPRMTPQGLRHSWATLALEAGEHPKVVADRLGHASVQITLDRYSHVTEGLDREAADRVAAMIDRGRG